MNDRAKQLAGAYAMFLNSSTTNRQQHERNTLLSFGPLVHEFAVNLPAFLYQHSDGQTMHIRSSLSLVCGAI